jgi:hypothetical protein
MKEKKMFVLNIKVISVPAVSRDRDGAIKVYGWRSGQFSRIIDVNNPWRLYRC